MVKVKVKAKVKVEVEVEVQDARLAAPHVHLDVRLGLEPQLLAQVPQHDERARPPIASDPISDPGQWARLRRELREQLVVASVGQVGAVLEKHA